MNSLYLPILRTYRVKIDTKWKGGDKMETKDTLKETLRSFNLKVVADETGINYSTLRNYVSGHRKLSTERRALVVDYIKSLSNRTY